MTLAPFVQIVARGQGRARPLTMPEAREAMRIILDGHASPEAVGALLMVLRFRGEVASEIAGFTQALRDVTPEMPAACLDWPSYAAGRTRGAPLFLLAARLVAQAGFRVVVHAHNTHQAAGAGVRDAVAALGIPLGAHTAPVSYFPARSLCPQAVALLELRDVLGLRSCINTVLRMWNPAGAAASVQGVFHPSYRGLQACAAADLGQQTLTVIKGGGGEFERHPAKHVQLFGLRDGAHYRSQAAALLPETRKLHEAEKPVDLLRLWRGQDDDPFAVATVTGTAALALLTLGAAPSAAQADELAAALWADRRLDERHVA